MTIRRFSTAVLGCLVLVLISSAMPAAAKTCASQSVTARGEIAGFEWLAKTKARANWRRKVRGLSDLGAPYANWSAADFTTERCIKADKSVYCVFSGTPCRP